MKGIPLTIAILLAFGAGCASLPNPVADCCSADKVLLDGVEAAQPNGVYRVQGDAVMPRRLADRETVMLRKNWNGMIARDEAMQFRAGERVRVIEVQRHVRVRDSVGPYFQNWSRVQSLERPQEAPVWIFDQALHLAQ